MKVAVITPYYDEPDSILDRCIDSVLQQDANVIHIKIADGYAKSWLLADENHITIFQE